jgi:hypothetical protein
MRLRAWIAGFHWLHAKARRGALTAEEAEAYREARDDLAAMLVAAQRLTVNTAQTAREATRVVRVFPIELDLPDGPAHGEVQDISTGGFSAILHHALKPDQVVAFKLELHSGPLAGRARVVSVQQHGPALRVSFKLEGPSGAEVERMASEVMDAALEQLANLIDQV